MTDLVLALDFGGTKIAAALVDPTGSVVRSSRVPTPSADPWDAVESLVALVVQGATVAGVGIA